MPDCAAYLGKPNEDGVPYGPCLMGDHTDYVAERHTTIHDQKFVDFWSTTPPTARRSTVSLDDKFGSSFTGGSKGERTYFDPKEFVNATVIMVEVKDASQRDNPFFEEDQPEDAKRNPRKRLEVLATLTVFNSPEELEAGVGKEIPNVGINQTYLASDLEGSTGKVEVYKLHLQPNKNPRYKPSWVWRGVDGPIVEQVKAYYVKREQDIAAALEGDGVPDFLKGA